jgi:hypothetical protein
MLNLLIAFQLIFMVSIVVLHHYTIHSAGKIRR